MAQRPFSDPATLAASVREIALQARRMLNDPSQSPVELRALSQRIDRIRDGVPGCPASPLARWLESLSREVENEQEFPGRRARLAESARAR